MHVGMLTFLLEVFLTCEIDVQTTELQFDTLESFSQCLVIMTDLYLGSSAEWKREEPVGLLAIVIWTNCVHP